MWFGLGLGGELIVEPLPNRLICPGRTNYGTPIEVIVRKNELILT